MSLLQCEADGRSGQAGLVAAGSGHILLLQRRVRNMRRGFGFVSMYIISSILPAFELRYSLDYFRR